MLTKARLAAALTTSGIVLQATAAGPWSLAPSALLWAVPSLIAVRSLPLLASLPIAFFTASVGRFIAFHDPQAAMLAAAVLLPTLLVDRLATTWLPRAGTLAFPAGLTATAYAVDALAPVTDQYRAFTVNIPDLVPQPSLSALAFIAHDGGTAAAVFVAAAFASAFAALGSILNRHVPEPYSPDVRDTGARWATVCALIAGIALLLVSAVRLRLQGEPSTVCDQGDVVAGASAVLFVVLIAAALSTWRTWRTRTR